MSAPAPEARAPQAGPGGAPPCPPGLIDLRPPVLICPDLHDWSERLRLLKLRLKAWRERFPETRLVLLGDTLDRGRAAAQTYAFIQGEVKTRSGVLISGNHELMACCGALQDGPESLQLYHLWQRVGGREWTSAMGGPREARAALEWTAHHAALGASLLLPGRAEDGSAAPQEESRLLLMHADVPRAAEWEWIEDLGLRHPSGAAHLTQVWADDAMETSGRTSFLWSWPGPGGWPGERVAMGHAAALHGHVPRTEPTALPPHRGHPGGLGLDLKSSARLCTVFIGPDGQATVES